MGCRLADINLKNEFYVATGHPPVEERIRALKYGPMFAVFDRYGNIRSSGLGEHGLYYRGTRYLSRLILTIGNTPPLYLSSGVRSDNSLFCADLTNVDLVNGDTVILSRGTIHLVRSRLLWNGVCYEQLRLTNYGSYSLTLPVRIEFASDFVDLFEVRGARRPRRGERLPDQIERDRILLQYRGLDEVIRCAEIRCVPVPTEISNSHVVMETELKPRETAKFHFTVRCDWESESKVENLDYALAALASESSAAEEPRCTVRTSNSQFNQWFERSLADVHMMIVGNPEACYPYAGVPWFSTVFGRDGIITALECLWLNPRIAEGVLLYLSETQAREQDPAKEADPGKIIHEMRHGEMAAMGEIPFGRYYGSVDSTPLYVMLAGAYYQRTGDLQLIRAIWKNIELALAWLDDYGDVDGDGFVEYQRRSAKGLVQQGWKDSNDSVFHADGSLAEAPIALCEVQGYAYAAKRCGAVLASALGEQGRAEELESQAESLKKKFNEVFWCEELSTYALALDRDKRPCRVRTSNAGHSLFTGIARTERAERLAQVLFGEDSFSGWGIRTVSSLERKYNPISYHNGSVWPHDNALIAQGLARYGFTELSARVMESMFEVSSYFEMNRLPELLCGLHRRDGEGPTLYPVACSPQAWSAGTASLLLASVLGLSLDANRKRVVLERPWLPDSISRVCVSGLQMGDGTVDLRVERRGGRVYVEVPNHSGSVDVVVREEQVAK